MTMFFPPQPPSEYTRPQTYYPPVHIPMPGQPPPYWQQPLSGYYYPPQVPYMPPGQQPARQNVKIAALICWVAATFIAIVGGTSTLVIAGLLNIAVFVLIFFI